MGKHEFCNILNILTFSWEKKEEEQNVMTLSFPCHAFQVIYFRCMDLTFDITANIKS